MANFNNQNVNYTSSVKYAAVSAWAATTAKTVGQFVRQTAPTGFNERLFVCYVAGTTGSTEPSWSISRGGKTTADGTVSWIEATGLPAFNGDSGNTPTWLLGAKSSAVDQGHVIKDAAGTHYFICTTSGVGGSTEPTWNTGSLGATTTDNSVTWTYIGPASSFTTAWAAPHAGLSLATANGWLSNLGSAQGRRTCYVGHDHAETHSNNNISFGNASYTNNRNNGNSLDIVCVSTAGSIPPVSADLATTATAAVTGANSIQIGNGNYRWVYGITFTVGNSANVNLNFNGDVSDRFYENCTFVIPSGAGSGANMQFYSAGRQHFKNCTFTFSNAGHSFNGNAANCEFDNCTFNGTSPTSNGFINNATNGQMIFRNCDFSAWASPLFHAGNSTNNSTFIFRDCKMPSGWAPGDVFANGVLNSTETLIFSRCNVAGGTQAYQYWQNCQVGSVQADATVARSGGAQDAGTAISWNCTTKTNITMNSSDLRPPTIAEWNSVTGSNVTATVYGIINAAALPTNDYCFVDIDYLGNSDTLGVRKSSRIADYLATPAAVTADTSDWTAGSVAARANTHAYSLGDTIKLASNPGRVFFCTTAGTSAGSEPGGYASAVDGGSVTDNTAVFRAGMRFKIALTLTSPGLAGNVYAQIRFGSGPVTVYFDPLLSLT